MRLREITGPSIIEAADQLLYRHHRNRVGRRFSLLSIQDVRPSAPIALSIPIDALFEGSNMGRRDSRRSLNSNEQIGGQCTSHSAYLQRPLTGVIQGM